MTEKTARKSIWPREAGPRYVIDPVAFFVALIGGPLLITAVSFWIVGIPIAALLFGGPVYLVLGTPLLLWHLRRTVGEGSSLALLALAAVLVPCLAMAGIGALTGQDHLLGIAIFYGGFGAIFGPAWAGGFAFIYDKMRSDFSRVPHTL